MLYPEFYTKHLDKFRKLNKDFGVNLLILAFIGGLLGFLIKKDFDIYFTVYLIIGLLFGLIKELPGYIHDIISIYIEDLEERVIKGFFDIKK